MRRHSTDRLLSFLIFSRAAGRKRLTEAETSAYRHGREQSCSYPVMWSAPSQTDSVLLPIFVCVGGVSYIFLSWELIEQIK